jgi:hypothetical protein
MDNYAAGNAERGPLVRPAWMEDGVEVGDERPQSPEEPALRRVATDVEESLWTYITLVCGRVDPAGRWHN